MAHDFAERFVCLRMKAGHPCTPSEHVDQASHLHLTYTRSYWERMCAELLPRPLHHGPTRGGDAEAEKFDDWYAKTKASYERLFGEEPPEDIWPAHDRRFGDDLRWERVNTAEHWVVRKRPVILASGIVGTAGAAFAVAGCSGQGAGPLPQGLRVVLLICAIACYVLILALQVRSIRLQESATRRGVTVFALLAFALGGGALIALLADRWMIPSLGIPGSTNDPATIVACVFVAAGLICWGAANTQANSGGGGNGGGCGGWFGIGGCSGEGPSGCGGGGRGGCGG